MRKLPRSLWSPTTCGSLHAWRACTCKTGPFRRPYKGTWQRLGLLSLPAEERGNVQVVRSGNFLADFAHVLLNLMHHVGRLHGLLHDFAPGFPGFGQEGLLR